MFTVYFLLHSRQGNSQSMSPFLSCLLLVCTIVKSNNPLWNVLYSLHEFGKHDWTMIKYQLILDSHVIFWLNHHWYGWSCPTIKIAKIIHATIQTFPQLTNTVVSFVMQFPIIFINVVFYIIPPPMLRASLFAAKVAP